MIRTPGLAGRLATVTAVLVTLAVAVVSLSGVRSLRRLADAEGLARTELAVAAARESLRDTDALSSGEPAAAAIRAENVYAASLPVITASGETVALLQALLPVGQVMDPVDTMTRRMFVIAVLIAVLAISAGIGIGRQWISGVYRLAEAARRIGAGDLAAAIPAEGGRELGVLAGTMDEMRRDLVGLTSELRRREAEAQAVLGGNVEGVYSVDQARRIPFLNPQAERLLCVSSGDALGRFCGDVLRPKQDDKGQRPCEKSCPIIQARRTGKAEATERVEPVLERRRRVCVLQRFRDKRLAEKWETSSCCGRAAGGTRSMGQHRRFTADQKPREPRGSVGQAVPSV